MNKEMIKSLLLNVVLFVLVAGAGYFSVFAIKKINEPPAFAQGDYSKYLGGVSDNTVVMYSTSWCSVCAKTRQYFNKQHILFIERDVEKKAKWRKDQQELKLNSVPIVIIGDHLINGFRPELFLRFSKNRNNERDKS